MAETIHRSKISTAEWGLVIGALLLIDFIQILLDFFAVGVAVNRFIDIAAGFFFLFYLTIRGEFKNPETRNRIMVAVAATFLLEEIPVLDAAPFWCADGYFCYRTAKAANLMADQKEQAKAEAEETIRIQENQQKMIQLDQIRQRQFEQQQYQQEEQDEDLYEEAA